VKRRTPAGVNRGGCTRWHGIEYMTGENVHSVSEIIAQAIANGPARLTQRSVAHAASISEKHLSQIIVGAVRMSARVAVRLEVPLGVPALELLLAQAVADVAAARAELE